MRYLDEISLDETKLPKLPKFGLILFVFTIFNSLKFSFLLNVNEYLIFGFLSFALLIFLLSTQKYFSVTDKSRVFILLFFLGILTATRGNLNAYIALILRVLPLMFFVLLKDEYKLRVLYSFDKVLSIIIAISLIAWILMLVGVPLPHIPLRWNSYMFHNYFFFLKIHDIFSFSVFPRFQCIFYEPGYFGCLCVIMIYLRGYLFKNWQSIVYLIALVLTYSLAGYLLFFIGLLVYVLKNKKGRIGYIFVLISLALVFFKLLNSDDGNAIYSMFAYRLEFEDGEMSGYNRTTDVFETWWRTYFLKHGNWLFGDNELINRFAGHSDVGVDLRVFIARFGIVPLLFYFGSMIYYYRCEKSNLGLYFLLLFVIYYYRGYTVMFFIGFQMLYIAGLCLFNKKTHNK